MQIRLTRSVLALLCAVPMHAATLSITAPSKSINPGQSATLYVGISGAGQLAAAQGRIALPSGWTATCAIAPSQAPAKTVACSAGSGALVFIVYGMNKAPLTDGPLLQITLGMPVPLTGGMYPLSFSGMVAATGEGDAAELGSLAIAALNVVDNNPHSFCCPIL